MRTSWRKEVSQDTHDYLSKHRGWRPAASPFHGPVRVADEIDRLIHLLQHYTALPNNDLAVLLGDAWVSTRTHSSTFGTAGTSRCESATPQCGKTRLLRLIGFRQGNRKPIAFPTAAVIFRCGWEVLLLDEVDQLRNGDKETFGALLAVLNFGFERGGAISATNALRTRISPLNFSSTGRRPLRELKGWRIRSVIERFKSRWNALSTGNPEW